MKKIIALLVFTVVAVPFVNAEDTTVTSDAGASKLQAEVMIGTGLENRELIGAADTFSASTGQLVGWSKVTGAVEPVQIMHVWKLNGEKVASVPLAVKSSPYRTNSRKTIVGSGKYALEVQDIDGNILGSKEVEVTN